MKKETPIKPEMYQSVWLTFSDGTRAGFSGKAHCFAGDTRNVTGVEFTFPKPLPVGAHFEPIEQPK